MLKSEAPQLVPIAGIVRDPRWYPRIRVPMQRVQRCAELYRAGGPEALPPITLGKLPHGPELLLVHGWQRVAGAEIAGLEALPAVTYGFLDGWEILATASRAAHADEEEHPMPLSLGEKTRVVDAFLQQFPGAEPVKMARRLGVSYQYLWKRRLRLNRGQDAADPLGRLARLLVKTSQQLHPGVAVPADLPSEESWQAVAAAVAHAARRQHGSDARLWLRRLEGLAREACLRLPADQFPASLPADINC